MDTMPKSLLPVALLVIGVALTGCEKKAGEGPAERAGRKIDQAVDKAGEDIAKATDAAGESLQRAGEKIREKTK
jgi:hypothetical protein